MKNSKVLLNNLTLLFLFILPFFSTIYFHKHIFTLIELLFILIIFISTIIIIPESRKSIKYIIMYFVLVLIYLLINYLRSFHFYSLVLGNFDYSLYNESLTITKLFMPSLFIYSLYYQKINIKYYIRVINYWSLLIGLIIIISSIFKIGYSSYGDSIITASIFDWLKSPYYIDAACKGFFMYANQIAVYLLMLMLINVYLFLEGKNYNLINIIILVLAMLILGTRVSTIGSMLTLICLIIMYYIINLFHKTKIKKRSFLLFIPLSLFILIPTSPYSNRMKEIEQYQEYEVAEIEKTVNDIIEDNNTNDNLKEDYKEEYVYNNYNPNYLSKDFFEEKYPINYDVNFWYSFVKKNQNKIISYRYIEQSIIKRIIKIDNRKSDYLFGISNTRIQNVVNVENDFILHFYAFGIIGSIILLFNYIVLFFICVKSFFQKQDYYTFIITTSFLLFLFCSYLTGNIINSLNITTPCLFIISGIFINGLKKD